MSPEEEVARKVLDACVAIGARIQVCTERKMIIAGMWIGWNELGQVLAVIFDGSAPTYVALDAVKLKEWYVPLEPGEWNCTERRFNSPGLGIF